MKKLLFLLTFIFVCTMAYGQQGTTNTSETNEMQQQWDKLAHYDGIYIVGFSIAPILVPIINEVCMPFGLQPLKRESLLNPTFCTSVGYIGLVFFPDYSLSIQSKVAKQKADTHYW
jgi:hypothetical protein